ncbi:hypothetical protein ACFQX7_20365 [Luedemannella flava]
MPAGWVASGWWPGFVAGTGLQTVILGIVSWRLWTLIGDPDLQRAVGYYGLTNVVLLPLVLLIRFVAGRLPTARPFGQGLLVGSVIGAGFVTVVCFAITRFGLAP